jgi:hypothetical protein
MLKVMIHIFLMFEAIFMIKIISEINVNFIFLRIKELPQLLLVCFKKALDFLIISLSSQYIIQVTLFVILEFCTFIQYFSFIFKVY